MTISWVGLLTLMVDGRDRPVRGELRSVPGSDETHGGVGWVAFSQQPRPLFPGAGPGEVRRVWRNGEQVRIEDGDGAPLFVTDGRTAWQFDPGEVAPVASPADTQRHWMAGTRLLERRGAESWLGTDFTKPTGPVGETTFLGRAAYTVELAPPAHKPYPVQLVVDAETGLVLQQRNDGFGSVEEWSEFVLGERFDDALFRWDGPARSWRDEQATRDAEHERDMARRAAWFTEHVAPLPLRVEVALDALVHQHGDDGAFEASLGHVGSLARRPRSEGDWDLHWREVAHRWSDARWDWALSIFDGTPLTDAALLSLQRQLGSTPS